jgi:hypothetical protein
MSAVAILMGMVTSGVCIAGDQRRPFVHQTTQVVIRPTETAITSKRARDLVITITNADGRLREGDNDFCVLLQKRATREPPDVQDVSVDFTLLVGRIQEQPIRAHLTPDQPGRYCGHVSLGKQYYVPASYYAFVRYTDATGNKRKERLFLSVK